MQIEGYAQVLHGQIDFSNYDTLQIYSQLCIDSTNAILNP